VPFNQVLIKLHYGKAADLVHFMKEMHRLNFYPFMNEMIHTPCISTGAKPYIAEYSFIRLVNPKRDNGYYKYVLILCACVCGEGESGDIYICACVYVGE